MTRHNDTPRFLHVATIDNPEDPQTPFNEVSQVHRDHLIGLGSAADGQSPRAEGETAATGESGHVVVLRDCREARPLGCDDLRQWTVVIWARTKLLERQLAAHGSDDPRLLAGLADIDAAVAAIGTRLDDLEDALARRAA